VSKFKRFGPIGLVAVLAATLLPAVPASAVDVTWRNTSSRSCTEYVESSSISLSHSRTGQRGQTPDVGGTQAQLVRITIQHGIVNTTQWSNDVAVNGARNYDRGRYKWRNDTCTDSTRGRAMATGASSPTRSTSEVPAGVAETASVESPRSTPTVLAENAAIYGFDPSKAVLKGDASGTKVWTIVSGTKTLVVTADADGTGTSGLYTTSDLAKRAVTLRNAQADGSVDQLVLTTAESAPAVSSVKGLKQVAPTLFVDQAAATREPMESVKIKQTGATVNARDAQAGTYEVVLFGADE
jgi:hypothetical protein